MDIMFNLDDYNLISSPIHEEFLCGNIKLLKNNNEIDFDLKSDKNKLSLYFTDEYEEGDIYQVIHNEDVYDVTIRFLVQSEKFDDLYVPDVHTLGSYYKKGSTEFRLWAPLSEGAYVVIEDEPYRMIKLDKGIYQASIKGELEGKKYHYDILRNGQRISVKDIFSYSNSKDNKDSYIVDTKKLKFQKIKVNNTNDPILYELSVRDFSIDSNAPFVNKGKFLAFCEKGLKMNGESVGIDYLKELGITHVQLMPIMNFDFDGSKYNWGYNPLDYNSFTWDYVVDDDPYAPIYEFRKLVDSLHENNIKVNLDVVYNHVYKAQLSTFNALFPNYFFRYDDEGKLADGSWCGNELRTEGKFVKEYLNLINERLFKIYDVDGLRFDLAGLIDSDSMNYWIDNAKKIKSNVMMYGEGWNMGNILPTNKKVCLENCKAVNNFAFFNPCFRNSLIGDVIGKNSKGFLLGNKSFEEDAKNAFSCNNKYGLPHNQSINYIECHDNLTFFDKASSFDFADQDIQAICKAGLAAVILSRGIPFIHAGQEFMRSKNGVDNSYNSNDLINEINWSLRFINNSSVNYLKELINFRKQTKVFNSDYSLSFSYYYDLLIMSIDKYDIFINPSEYPYVYSNWITYTNVLYGDLSIVHNISTFDIPKYSLVVAEKQ